MKMSDFKMIIWKAKEMPHSNDEVHSMHKEVTETPPNRRHRINSN